MLWAIELVRTLNHAEIIVQIGVKSILASSEYASTSSSLNPKYCGLQDLHDCIDKLLQLPLTQQILAQKQQMKYVDELLNGSLRLLDVCTTAKDALLQVKECTPEIQSILRLKKAAKKAMLKALKNFKHRENKQPTVYKETEAMVSLFREVKAVTLNVLESLLSFTFGPEKEPKRSHGH
ncbi:hypothetical protein REPUB_Repub04eG0031800 [Reevesia pubescens]